MSDSSAVKTSEAPVVESSDRWRSVTAVICVVLAALLTTPAAFAFWGQRTLNDTQRYVATVGPLVDSPQVQDAIATTVTSAIQQQVDVEALINQAFAGVITDRVVGSSRAGSIVVMHAQDLTAAALPEIISRLRAKGLEPVGLSELFAQTGAHVADYTPRGSEYE